MAKKQEQESVNAVEVFQSLQDFATRAGASRSTFKLNRADGWKWEFVVTSPDHKEDEAE